jgi:hypothetical protein
MANPSYDATKENFRGLTQANGPARFATAITPSDTVAVAIGPGGGYAKRLWIGSVAGGATLTVIMAADQTNGGLGTPILFSGVLVGYMDIQVRAVMATGTLVSNIVGLCD